LLLQASEGRAEDALRGLLVDECPVLQPVITKPATHVTQSRRTPAVYER
jgi:hypothetical protein